MSSKYAPLIVFCFNRYNEVMQTMMALKDNILASETEIYIYSDGAREGNDDESAEVERIRRDITVFKPYFKEFHLIAHKKNIGMNPNIIGGITEIMQQHGRAIIVEDDIVTSQNFLSFMNQALDKYEGDKDVFSICTYNPMESDSKLPGDTFCFDVFWCWGWATWADRWQLFEYTRKAAWKVDAVKYSAVSMLFAPVSKYDTLCPQNPVERLWDYKTAATQMSLKKKVVYSKKSLSDNIGMNGTGITSANNKGYINRNFDRNDDRTSFIFSDTKLTKWSDAEYYFDFRYKEYAMDIYFAGLFDRNFIYRNMYYGISRMLYAGVAICDFFKEKNIKKIAIYGWAEAGKMLFDLLKGSDITISYAVDRKLSTKDDRIRIYHDMDGLPECDAMVVTALQGFHNIERGLFMSGFHNDVFCMDDIVTECVKGIKGYFPANIKM